VPQRSQARRSRCLAVGKPAEPETPACDPPSAIHCNFARLDRRHFGQRFFDSSFARDLRIAWSSAGWGHRLEAAADRHWFFLKDRRDKHSNWLFTFERPALPVSIFVQHPPQNEKIYRCARRVLFLQFAPATCIEMFRRSCPCSVTGEFSRCGRQRLRRWRVAPWVWPSQNPAASRPVRRSA